jgi:hypothetical protein
MQNTLAPVMSGSGTAPAASTGSATPWQRPTTRPGGAWRSQSGQGQQQSTAPTSADLSAFSQALESAAALGVISPTDVASYQSSANTATDAQLQALTAQINALVASTPSAAAAATAATATTATTTTTSWWDDTTTLFGSQIQNSTLAIGGIAALAFAYFAFGKKK